MDQPYVSLWKLFPRLLPKARVSSSNSPKIASANDVGVLLKSQLRRSSYLIKHDDLQEKTLPLHNLKLEGELDLGGQYHLLFGCSIFI